MHAEFGGVAYRLLVKHRKQLGTSQDVGESSEWGMFGEGL